MRENLTPGFKFNDWELRGVPSRIEIGPKDVQKNSVALARRDKPGRKGKSFVPQAGLLEAVQSLLATIQSAGLVGFIRRNIAARRFIFGRGEQFHAAVRRHLHLHGASVKSADYRATPDTCGAVLP